MNLRQLIFASVGAAVLAGCAQTQSQYSEFNEPRYVPKIKVNKTTRQFSFYDPGTSVNLSHGTLHRLRADLRRFSQGRPDSVHLKITVPGGGTRQGITNVLQDLRIPSDNGVWDHSHRSNRIVIDASLYTAIPPKCKPRSIHASPLNNNLGDVDRGCSNLANLARSVADAKDFVGRDFAVLSTGQRASEGIAREEQARAEISENEGITTEER